MTRLVYVILFVCLLKTSFQKSTPADSSYVAAVIEYRHVSNTSVNLQNYLLHIEEAANKSADIVVFPEMTLNPGRPPIAVPIYGALKDYPIPALSPSLYDDVLVQLSAAAARFQVYLVVNVVEQMNCSSSPAGEDCPELKVYQFNTNVVFDRTGAVISRYRKINLFGEDSRTPALRPDLGVFTTDFGVTFGHFICFDLMFQVPAVQVVQKYNITDVVFTTMWFSELPFLTAVQIQEAFAYSMNVNLLASGANNVRAGSAGSGIYSGKAGALVSTMPGMPATRLMVSRVPKVPGNVTWSTPGPIVDPPSDADTLKMKQDPSLAAHATRLLVPGFQEFQLSQNDVTCKFKVNLTRRGGGQGPEFRAFVHAGTNTYGQHNKLGIRSCAVVACASADDVTTCGSIYNQTESTLIIEELKITMTTPHVPHNTTLQCENAVFFPDTVMNNRFPLEPTNYNLTIKKTKIKTAKHAKHEPTKSNKQVKATMKLKGAHCNLVSFAIWTRNYLEDVNLRDVKRQEGAELAEGEGMEYIMDNAWYEYRAGAFDGVRTFDGFASGGTRACSLMACTSANVTSCGLRFDTYAANTTAIFEELSITATVPTPQTNLTFSATDSAFFPVSVDVSTLPLKTTDYAYTEAVQGGKTTYTMRLLKKEVELYGFAVWGRRFGTDGQDPTPPLPGAGSTHLLNVFLLVSVLLVYCM